MFLSDVTRAMACPPSSSASNESCLHFVGIAGLANRLKTSESIRLYPVFAFVCYVSIHLEISATVVRSAPEERLMQTMKSGVRTGDAPSPSNNRQDDRSSCSHRNRCRRQMPLMTFDLLFVAKRLAFLSDEKRLTWFCRDKEVRAKGGLM
jgi:hypothetical protein